MTRKLLLAAGLVAAMTAATSAQALPCAGFTDVDSTSAFCPNVEWMKNRSITLGCTSATLYCPTDVVTRLSMAAFMQRLGDALLPAVLFNNSINNPDIDSAAPPGLAGPGVLICTTCDLPAATYPRRAIVDTNTSGRAQGGIQGVRQRLAVSTDAGVNWALVAPTSWNKVSNIAVGTYYSMTSNYAYDIAVGQATRYAILLDRYDSAVVAGVDFSDHDCNIRRQIFSRTGAASPFDEDIQLAPSRD